MDDGAGDDLRVVTMKLMLLETGRMKEGRVMLLGSWVRGLN